jgi:hypothetical protein
MADPIGGTSPSKDTFGGTTSLNVPPFLFGCQWFLLALFKVRSLDLPMKKAARWLNLAAFKLASGGAGGN